MSEFPYDAILFVSFGGPECRDDVIPFLENVLRGRNVPRERLLQVAEHYYHFGGVSPINAQNRALIEAVTAELREHGITLPVYWGNRNWHPLLPETVAQMQQDGIQRALAFVTAAFSSYSSCRQYRENLADACQTVGPGAPKIEKIRAFYNHPDFIAANAGRAREAINRLPADCRDRCQIAFTAHSIPCSMSESSDYVLQLIESCRLIAEELKIPPDQWDLVWQSRSGRPQDPWLEPDILDHLDDLARKSVPAVVAVPVGFLSDHMEVLYDLDEEASQKAAALSVTWERAGTVGTHPRFVTMIRKLICERLEESFPREAIGQYAPHSDACSESCCPGPRRR